MVEGIVEGAISSIARIALFLGRMVIEIVLMMTGETVLWVVTAGRRPPPWKVDHSERLAVTMVFFELSLWIGLATWLAILVLLRRVLS
jgi:hypothetical protein